jgi:DNA-binding transcriptional LysR family regulator
VKGAGLLGHGDLSAFPGDASKPAGGVAILIGEGVRFSRIKEFIKLARTLNYTQAAGELFTTQPVLSRHIAALEAELGVRLFERSTHEVALTPAGLKALEGFEGILAQYDSLLQNLKSQGAGLSGALAIGILYYAIDGYLETVINPMRKIAPGIDLSVVSYQPPKLAEDLAQGKIDLGLTLKPAVPSGAEVREVEINEEKLVLLCPEGHPLAKRRKVEASHLDGQRFVFMAKENWQEPYITDILSKNNIKIAETYYTEQIDTLADSIINNNAISILAGHARSMNRKGIKFVQIKNNSFKIAISVVFMADNKNPCLNIFIEWLENNKKTIYQELKIYHSII